MAGAGGANGEGFLTQPRLFVLLGVVAAAAIIGLRVQSLILERDQVLQQRQAQAATLAQLAATYSARLYDQSSRVAREVAAQVRAAEPDDGALQAYLAARAGDTSADDYIVVLDAAGRIRATSEGPKPTAAAGYGPRLGADWQATDQEVAPVRRSRLTGSVIYPLAQRLEGRDGRFLGVVGVNVRPAGIRDVASRKPDDPLLTVWDQDGRFIAASFIDFDSQGQPVVPAKPHGLAVPGSSRVHDGSTISASAPVQGWPLIAVASYDTAGVLTEWRKHVGETAVFLVLTVVGLMALVWLGLRTADREARARRGLVEANAVAAEALRRRDLLMREVDHRVKNSLMMTASLLRLQERRFTDPEVREAFESTRLRLNSIGLVHEALYSGSSLEEVELGGYLRGLVDELGRALGAEARGVVIDVEAEPLRLAAQQITPVGLIVAEVVTNAFKHAFGRDGSGTIFVRARHSNLDEMEIEIRDDGSGYATLAPEGPGGLGSRLIDALSEQLNGTLSLANEGGAAFRLTFPQLVRTPPAGAADQEGDPRRT